MISSCDFFSEVQAKSWQTNKIIASESSEERDLDPFWLMKEESLGELRIDLPAVEVIQLIGHPKRKGERVVWGADGLAHQDWYYDDRGIIINMASLETEPESESISSLKLISPCNLKTKRGISIGSSLSEVQLAYGNEQDKETSIAEQSFIAGSIYGGLIFTLENGYVSEIFLGAAAE